MNRCYDLERLQVFINTYGFKLNPKPEHHDVDLLHAAACALMDALLYEVDLRKKLGLAKKRGQRGKGKQGRKIKENGRIVTETARYMTGFQSYGEAAANIAEFSNTGIRNAQNELKSARKQAQSLINIITLFEQLERTKNT